VVNDESGVRSSADKQHEEFDLGEVIFQDVLHVLFLHVLGHFVFFCEVFNQFFYKR